MHFTAEDATQRLAPYVRDVSVQVLQVIFFISFYFQWWTVNVALSPGITISVPSGNWISPVTSVVLK